MEGLPLFVHRLLRLSLSSPVLDFFVNDLPGKTVGLVAVHGVFGADGEVARQKASSEEGA